jgi:geranylgeranyl diphosphate synthase type II
MDLNEFIRDRARLVDRALDRLLPPASTKPATLHRAMRYSIFAGGKRLRPVLCLTAAEACRGPVDAALPAACAVECIHTYSLIHDDLPCMDDDDLRRGQPTSHKVFGEGIAVLAGDALLTAAFEILARAVPGNRYPLAALVAELTRAAGSRELIAGQVADLEAEGRQSARSELRFIHERKTAAMIVASLRLGAMSANAPTAKLAALTDFGRRLGLAFQIVDDILDVIQTREKLGKSAGKDAATEKTTYPSVIGLDASRREAKRLTASAMASLKPFGARAQMLEALAERLLVREF